MNAMTAAGFLVLALAAVCLGKGKEGKKMSLETVAIKNKHGRRALISKSNYDPKTMQLWSAPAAHANDGKKTADDGKK